MFSSKRGLKRKLGERDDMYPVCMVNKRRKLVRDMCEIKQKDLSSIKEVNVGDKVDVVPLDFYSKKKYGGWRGGIILEADIEEKLYVVEFLRAMNTIVYEGGLKEIECLWVTQVYRMDSDKIRPYESLCKGAAILESNYVVKQGENLSDLGYCSLIHDDEEVDTEHEVLYVWGGGEKTVRRSVVKKIP